jgi:hypothetical protein
MQVLLLLTGGRSLSANQGSISSLRSLQQQWRHWQQQRGR